MGDQLKPACSSGPSTPSCWRSPPGSSAPSRPWHHGAPGGGGLPGPNVTAPKELGRSETGCPTALPGDWLDIAPGTGWILRRGLAGFCAPEPPKWTWSDPLDDRNRSLHQRCREGQGISDPGLLLSTRFPSAGAARWEVSQTPRTWRTTRALPTVLSCDQLSTIRSAPCSSHASAT